MSSTKKPLSRYCCAQCGKRLRGSSTDGGYVYSRFTGNRYCPALTCKPRKTDTRRNA
jgi:hypothetical protein